MQNRSVYEGIGKEEDNSGISRRVSQITVSAIKQMPILAAELGGCVSLGQGIQSFNTPDFIRQAVIEELKKPDSSIGKYSMQPGMPELKAEVARDLKRTRGIDADPDDNIFISCGGMESLAASIAAVVDRGDEVILPSPCYASHIEQILFAEGVPVFVPLIEEEGWRLDLPALKKAISSKTKAIIISNPVNPTGTIFTKTDLLALAELALAHKLFVISDEAYDFLIYDNLPYYSLISMPELKDQLIAVCSFSKRYCMTGWRVGYMYSSRRILQQVLKVHDAFAICAPTISQFAALAALKATNGKDGLGDQSTKELCEALERRRNLVCGRLEQLSSEFSYSKPQGGYYIFPRLNANQGSIDYTVRMLKEARVITIPGVAFGPTGEGHIRLSFGAADEELTEACNRLEAFVRKNSN